MSMQILSKGFCLPRGICVLILFLQIVVAHAETGPVVTTNYGQVRGITENNLFIFKGIPYAQPPVGDLRWQPPQTFEPWQGILPTNAFNNDCMQLEPAYDPLRSRQTKSEDCLYLNIWSADLTATNKAPVMVWIHGGGFVQGSAAELRLDGANLAKRGVVVVTFNYRLGRFGFFAHPALTEEARQHNQAFANYGLLDQIAALRWVKNNIAAFGGDPNNITVFGESAGGAAVNLLMVNDDAQQLMDKAIVQSGGGRDIFAYLDRDRPLKKSAHAAGLAMATRASLSHDATVAELRAIPATTLVGNLGLINMEAETFSGTIIDGTIVRGEAHLEFAANRQDKIPYLIGSNSGELSALPVLGFMQTELLKQYGDAAESVIKIYGSEVEENNRSARLINEAYFNEPARRFARSMAAMGAPTYLYRFSYVAESERETYPDGAAHASEITYVFNTVDATIPAVTEKDSAMAALMSDYWVAFAKTGDPNGQGRAKWPRYNVTADPLLDFTHNGPLVREHLDEQRLDTIAELYPNAN